MMNRLEEIFNKQKELMVKYHEIEENSGIVTTTKVPLDLDEQKDQQRVRDFAWRLTEELAETIHEVEIQNGEVTEEVKEEIVDCLHFLTEMTIAVGVEPHEVIETRPYHLDNLQTLFDEGQRLAMSHESIHETITSFISKLGMTINTLKNKAWKQTMKPTDKGVFYTRLEYTWVHFFAIVASVNLSDGDIYQKYVFKNEKNKQRQQNNY